MLTSRTTALALGLGLLSGGCGAAPSALGSLAGLEAGTTTLRVSNHVAAPGELDRVTIAVDGEPIPLSSVPPEGGAPAVVASLRLAPGGHTIAVRARAHGPDGEAVVIGAQQPFLVERGPAAITVDVRSGLAAHAGGRPGAPSDVAHAGAPSDLGATSDQATATPVAVTLTILGGRMAPEFGLMPSDDKDERCASLLPIPRALCRAAVDLDEATRRNDIVATLCVRDKLGEMRKLAIIGESGKGDSVTMAESQIATLSVQVELCAGDGLAAHAPDAVTVTRP